MLGTLAAARAQAGHVLWPVGHPVSCPAHAVAVSSGVFAKFGQLTVHRMQHDWAHACVPPFVPQQGVCSCTVGRQVESHSSLPEARTELSTSAAMRRECNSHRHAALREGLCRTPTTSQARRYNSSPESVCDCRRTCDLAPLGTTWPMQRRACPGVNCVAPAAAGSQERPVHMLVGQDKLVLSLRCEVAGKPEQLSNDPQQARAA